MGFHSNKMGTVQRTPRAHLTHDANGDIYGYLALGFKKDAKRFEYCFIGEQAGRLTYDGAEIAKHPKFIGIYAFESWCRKYCAEHDL